MTKELEVETGNMVRRTYYMDQRQVDLVEILSIERGIPRSEIVREALSRYLEDCESEIERVREKARRIRMQEFGEEV